MIIKEDLTTSLNQLLHDAITGDPEARAYFENKYPQKCFECLDFDEDEYAEEKWLDNRDRVRSMKDF